ncbi:MULTISPECIES: phage tail assembly protein [Burkholderia]|uniref:phage tail assembly protein n=1 Tax=Burkholderia TaxID=32008 RepID=UPI001199FCB9|nr:MULTISPECIES: phage tail assembly protein [Burkholderia]MDJ1160779.1 phage tail assembly protein [Burkholderia gladioli pv. gladioli]MDN7741577.1 phage tail assembly protein [Burkholderia gladioli]TWC65250.1 tail assembly chaperone E/41/14-like protein [Burkholderia sp. SJZ089]TWC97899.1 tail assembly chaperone E/41/14-like protein [Burkholderia sp. SJZ115]TWD01231.1 tail assembly chaperone E/41/14-like protein [Burkholderia sp. SJZ091]
MEGNENKPRKVQPPVISIELEDPIKVKSNGEEEVITELSLCEPTLDQIETFLKVATSKGPIKAVRALISEQSKVPEMGLGKIKAREYYRAQEYLMFFLSPQEEDDPEGNAAGSQ